MGVCSLISNSIASLALLAKPWNEVALPLARDTYQSCATGKQSVD